MSKEILYFECFSGISGDMTVASLLDLGANEQVLLAALKSLKVDGYEVKIGRTKKCGIDACDFDVLLDSNKSGIHNHTHDEEHNHHDEHHSHEEHVHADHTHTEHLHVHNELKVHEHRNIESINDIIDAASISDRAKLLAKKIFHIVAQAEAKAHNIELNEVHFHEVGAVDSIVDVIATAVCIENLNIDEIVVSELYEGSGHVKCQHGILPVPVPAVVNIAAAHSLQLKLTDAKGEMVTPTGAAIVAALKTRELLPAKYVIKGIGIGAGKKNFEKANILRAYLIEEAECEPEPTNESVWVLETNIDDSTSESLAYTMEKLFENGANDVFFTPIYMKKNRPAFKLTVLCTKENIKLMEALIFKNTTTIGIRRYQAERTVLNREIIEVQTSYGIVKVKCCSFEDQKFYYPEYEEIKKICDLTGIGYQKVHDDILLAIDKTVSLH